MIAPCGAAVDDVHGDAITHPVADCDTLCDRDSYEQPVRDAERLADLRKRLNRLPKSDTSFFVPLDALVRQRPLQRDMTVAGVSGSNYLVGTENQAASFIDLLRNTSVTMRMGITRLSGLQGNVTIPKMTAGNTAYWLADEGTAATDSTGPRL